jgi:hypothetical protein
MWREAVILWVPVRAWYLRGAARVLCQRKVDDCAADASVAVLERVDRLEKGWYIPSRPEEPAGENTTWYAAFWAFAAQYLESRFGEEWCLSADQSLLLHVGDRTVPSQLLVRAPKGGNKPTPLPHDTSVFDVRLELPAGEERTTIGGLRVMTLAAALAHCSPDLFRARPVELRAALAMLTDAADLLRCLLEGGKSKVAGRLAGALLAAEPEPAVRVVLGQFLFVYVHPYFDGNGCMGRFLMNLMVASGGWRWTLVTLDTRNAYRSALEQASVHRDIAPFTRYLAARLAASVQL